MSLKQIKILVVDDSAFMRLLIADLLSEDEELDVVGTANNGLDASEKVKTLKPDLVVLDMNMAEYDGLFAVKAIMKERPTPILILSSVGNTNLDPIFEALKLGAVDYMNKPSQNNFKMRSLNSELIGKVKSVARAKPKMVVQRTPAKKKTKRLLRSDYQIIVIGASTGGPSAIEQVITDLPSDFNVPIIICQHMPAPFIAPFVQRLNSLTDMEVEVGIKPFSPASGKIFICPGDVNTIITAQGTKEVSDVTDEKYREYNNPSINALMLSVAEVYKKKAVGVLLTGMGKDGVRGLGAINDAGGFTIAQDKGSSVIYGMPKGAVEAGAVKVSLDIKEIGNYLASSLK